MAVMFIVAKEGTVTVKVSTLVTVPQGVVTLMVPVVVPVATTASMVLSFTTVKLAAAVPLKLTAVAPLKDTPLMVTVVPTGPLNGLKLLRASAAGSTRAKVSINWQPITSDTRR